MCIKELTGLVTLFTNQGIEIIPYLLLRKYYIMFMLQC